MNRPGGPHCLNVYVEVTAREGDLNPSLFHITSLPAPHSVDFFGVFQRAPRPAQTEKSKKAPQHVIRPLRSS